MRKLVRVAAATAVAIAVIALPPATALATTGLPRAVKFAPHVILKGGRLALQAQGSRVVVSRLSHGNKRQYFFADHSAGAGVAGGGGKFTLDLAAVGKSVRATTSGTSLVPTGPTATQFTASPRSGPYTALTLLSNGRVTKYELTDHNGHLVLAKEGRHGPSNDQLWTLSNS